MRPLSICMKSMTGFGRGEAADGRLSCCVELSSVNRKQSDIDVRLPREYAGLEQEVRRAAGAVLSRGRLQIGITLETVKAGGAVLTVDYGLAAQYAAALQKMDREYFGGGGGTTAEALLRAPGVFVTAETAPVPPEEVWPVVSAALGKALGVWDRARSREGVHLRRDIEGRLTTLGKLVKGIRREAPKVVALHREALSRRLKEAGVPLPLDDERFVREVAMFADRSDIAEELSRLDGHLEEFRRLLKASEPSGRAMDFLCQELNRELNTVGSKAGNLGIAHSMVAGKTEVERIREQVQNVE